MKKIIAAIICISLLTNSGFAQTLFEGVIKMNVSNTEMKETGTVEWRMKDGNNWLHYDAATPDGQYQFSILMKKNDNTMSLISDAGGEKMYREVPVSSVSSAHADWSNAIVTSTNEKRNIGGYECTGLTITGGASKAICWVTNDATAIVAELPGGLMNVGAIAAIRKAGYKGIPMEITVTDGSGKKLYSQTVTSVERISISSEEFKVPSNVKKFETKD